jgi:hypothetical protein
MSSALVLAPALRVNRISKREAKACPAEKHSANQEAAVFLLEKFEKKENPSRSEGSIQRAER